MKKDQNISMSYYLRTAFDYEIRNNLDIRINQLSDLTEKNSQDLEELDNLIQIKGYLEERIVEMKS